MGWGSFAPQPIMKDTSAPVKACACAPQESPSSQESSFFSLLAAVLSSAVAYWSPTQPLLSAMSLRSGAKLEVDSNPSPVWLLPKSCSRAL